MQLTLDPMGRIVIPKSFRDEFGLRPGAELDLSHFGSGMYLEPGSRSARLEPEGEYLVLVTDDAIDDETMYELIDAGRR